MKLYLIIVFCILTVAQMYSGQDLYYYEEVRKNPFFSLYRTNLHNKCGSSYLVGWIASLLVQQKHEKKYKKHAEDEEIPQEQKKEIKITKKKYKKKLKHYSHKQLAAFCDVGIGIYGDKKGGFKSGLLSLTTGDTMFLCRKLNGYLKEKMFWNPCIVDMIIYARKRSLQYFPSFDIDLQKIINKKPKSNFKWTYRILPCLEKMSQYTELFFDAAIFNKHLSKAFQDHVASLIEIKKIKDEELMLRQKQRKLKKQKEKTKKRLVSFPLLLPYYLPEPIEQEESETIDVFS